MLFDKSTQIEEILKLYGISIPCEMNFVGDSNEVMFKFENTKEIINEPLQEVLKD